MTPSGRAPRWSRCGARAAHTARSQIVLALRTRPSRPVIRRLGHSCSCSSIVPRTRPWSIRTCRAVLVRKPCEEGASSDPRAIPSGITDQPVHRSARSGWGSRPESIPSGSPNPSSASFDELELDSTSTTRKTAETPDQHPPEELRADLESGGAVGGSGVGSLTPPMIASNPSQSTLVPASVGGTITSSADSDACFSPGDRLPSCPVVVKPAVGRRSRCFRRPPAR